MVVTGPYNNATNSAFLTVLTNTTARGPGNQSCCPGSAVIFSTIPYGTGPFTYVWKFNGVVLSNQVDNAIVLVNVSSTNAGTYTVIVTGDCSSVTNSATLTVYPVTTATGPVSLTNCPGTTATFSTTPSGTGPFKYAWKFNGVTLTNRVSDPIVLANVSSTNAGNYTVIVTGDCSSVTNSASLTVLTNTSAVGPTNLVLNAGQTAVFTVVPSGNGPFSYVWRQNGSLLPGQTTNQIIMTNVSAANAGTYTVEVYGHCNSVTNSAILTVNQSMSVIIIQPSANAVFVAPATIPISATVSNAVSSIRLVNYYANGIWIGSDAVSSGNAYSFTWAGVPANGSNYVLTATAVDALNNTATSPGISSMWRRRCRSMREPIRWWC